jgi:Skp family chaperone for outer membrane proteins
MKNFSLILNIVLVVLVLLLYIDRFAFNSGKTDNNNLNEFVTDTTGTPQIVFVNLDSLLDGYSLYNELMLDYYAKQDLLESQMQTKYTALERKSYELQEKYEKGLITSAKAQEQQEELYLEQQQLTTWQQEKSQELLEDETGITQRVYDSIQNAIDFYNQNHLHRLILNNSYGGVLLHGDENLNITDTITTIINLRYTQGLKTVVDTTSAK